MVKNSLYVTLLCAFISIYSAENQEGPSFARVVQSAFRPGRQAELIGAIVRIKGDIKEGETQEEYTARYLRTKEAILRNHPSTHRDALPETIAFLYYAITTLASYYHPTGSEHQRILSTDSLLDLKESSRKIREEIATAWAMYEAEKNNNFSPASIQASMQIYRRNLEDNYIAWLHDIGLIPHLPNVSLQGVPDRAASLYSSFLNSGLTHPLWR